MLHVVCGNSVGFSPYNAPDNHVHMHDSVGEMIGDQDATTAHPKVKDLVFQSGKSSSLEAPQEVADSVTDQAYEVAPVYKPRHHGHIHTSINEFQSTTGNNQNPSEYWYPDHKIVDDSKDKSEKTSVISLGWILAGGILIFAFVNTILLGTTLLFTYGILQWFVGLIKVFAPPVAVAFSNSMKVMTAPFSEVSLDWLGL